MFRFVRSVGFFTCQNGSTYRGQSVYVAGSITELGSWSPASGVVLGAANFPTWQGTINNLPENATIEWKCVKRDESNPNADIEWQGGSNNVLTTGGNGSVVSSTGSF